MSTEAPVKPEIPVYYPSTMRFERPLDDGRYVEIEVKLPKENEPQSYWAVTGTVYRGFAWESGGCCHKEILQAMPELAPVVGLHLAKYGGQPMHALDNAYYWIAGVVGGLGEEYHGGNQEPKRDCLPIVQSHLRVTEDEAKDICRKVEAAHDAYTAAVAIAQAVKTDGDGGEVVSPMVSIPTGRDVLAEILSGMQERWIQESKDALALCATLHAKEPERKSVAERIKARWEELLKTNKLTVRADKPFKRYMYEHAKARKNEKREWGDDRPTFDIQFVRGADEHGRGGRVEYETKIGPRIELYAPSVVGISNPFRDGDLKADKSRKAVMLAGRKFIPILSDSLRWAHNDLETSAGPSIFAPTPVEALAMVVMEASSVRYGETHEDFCSNIGFSDDSIKGKEAYDAALRALQFITRCGLNTDEVFDMANQ